METITSLFAILEGFLVRLAIPIIGTIVLIYFLRKLDAHWQAEAQVQLTSIQKVECWKIKGCSPEQQKFCIATSSALPCWQAKRLPNGYLREECLTCEIFTQAPIPTLKTASRRV